MHFLSLDSYTEHTEKQKEQSTLDVICCSAISVLDMNYMFLARRATICI